MTRKATEELQSFKKRKTCSAKCRRLICSLRAKKRKLQAREVLVMRTLAPYFTMELLGRGFGVSRATVYSAVTGQTWQNI